ALRRVKDGKPTLALQTEGGLRELLVSGVRASAAAEINRSGIRVASHQRQTLPYAMLQPGAQRMVVRIGRARHDPTARREFRIRGTGLRRRGEDRRGLRFVNRLPGPHLVALRTQITDL